MLFRLLAVLLFFSATLVQAQPLREQIDTILANSGLSSNTWGMLIQSDDGTIDYYAKNSDLPLTPASNTKMVTTAGAFGVLGPEHAFETHVYYDGVYTGGTLDGNLNLVVEHDLTWNDYCLNAPDEALDFLATVLSAQGLSSIQGGINVYGAAFYDRGQFNDIRFRAPSYDNQAVADVFRTSLLQAGVSVTGLADGRTGFNAPGELVYTHLSSDLLYDNTEGAHNGLDEMPLTLATACIEINRVSHNAMADGLLMHVGYKALGQSTLDAGAAAVLDWLENEAGIDTKDLVYGDGSGLARGIDSRPGNRFPARFYVQLTRHMIEHFPSWDTTLAINCKDGTIGNRMCSPSNLVGRVHAKTGSLNTTIALSGYLDHPLAGERLYFSFLANDSSGIAQSTTRATMDNVVRLVAGTFPPVAPNLSHVAASTDRIDAHVAQQFTNASSFDVVYTINGGGEQAMTLPQVQPYIIETRSGQQNTGDYAELSGNWLDTSASAKAPGATGSGGGRWAIVADGADVARFTPTGIPAGRYEVDVSNYGIYLSNNSHLITVRMNDADGLRERLMDLSFETTGDVWGPVGVLNFFPGEGHYVEFSNETQRNVGTSSNSRMAMNAVRFVPTTAAARIDGLSPGDRVSVFARSKGAGESSAASDVYTARTGSSKPRVLLVDGNDRYVYQPVNPSGANHDFLTRIGSVIDSEAFDAADNDAIERGEVDLNQYKVAVYLLGEESTYQETFSDTEQRLVADFLANGGGILVSGSEVGWDLGARGTPSDNLFLNETLGIVYIQDKTSSSIPFAEPVSGGLYKGILAIDYAAGPLTVEYPDVLAPAGADGTVAMYYAGTTEGAAILRGEESRGSVVAFGFPITMITSDEARRAVVARSLEYLLGAEIPGDAWMMY